MPTRFSLSRRTAQLLPLLALSLWAVPGHADTVVTAPQTERGVVAVVPGGPQQTSGTPVVVAAAIDTSGNADNAKQALLAANKALNETPGLSPVSTSQYAVAKDVAAKMKDVNWAWPFTATDYQKIGTAFKGSAPKGTSVEAVTITVTPTGKEFDAVAELYDTSNGGLVGRGTGHSSRAGDPLETAVGRAVQDLNETATFQGVVISKPEAYMARISAGERLGVRGGARVEYLQDGVPIAYGTVIDLGFADSLCTVAPESAFPKIGINTQINIVNNPVVKRALKSINQKDDQAEKKFETHFALASAIALAVYYISD